MSTLTLDRLRGAVAKDAAIRRVQKLQPVGGPGDKIFPPTYPGERSTDPARHVFETRRLDGKDVRCVLIDSVQSQANRLEEALLAAMRAGRVAMPYITVEFKGQKSAN
jgi:CRISPR-associated protein Csb1